MGSKKPDVVASSTFLDQDRRLQKIDHKIQWQFQWRHLVIVAVMTGVIQNAICLGCLVCFCSRFRGECLLIAPAKHEAEKMSLASIPPCACNLSDRHRSTDQPRSSGGAKNPLASRMRRQSNGRRSTRRPNGSNNKRLPLHNRTAAVIHLEFNIPILTPEANGRLLSESSHVETVEHGHISQQGFKPSADRFNGTERYSFRNWTPAKWFNSTSVFQYNSQRGTIKVLRSGLYYIYSQIRFHHTRPCSYALMVNEANVLLKCIDGTAGEPLWQFSNCYLGAVTALIAGDWLWLKDLYGENSQMYDCYVHLDPVPGASSFWGAIHIGDL